MAYHLIPEFCCSFSVTYPGLVCNKDKIYIAYPDRPVISGGQGVHDLQGHLFFGYHGKKTECLFQVGFVCFVDTQLFFD